MSVKCYQLMGSLFSSVVDYTAPSNQVWRTDNWWFVMSRRKYGHLGSWLFIRLWQFWTQSPMIIYCFSLLTSTVAPPPLPLHCVSPRTIWLYPYFFFFTFSCSTFNNIQWVIVTLTVWITSKIFLEVAIPKYIHIYSNHSHKSLENVPRFRWVMRSVKFCCRRLRARHGHWQQQCVVARPRISY